MNTHDMLLAPRNDFPPDDEAEFVARQLRELLPRESVQDVLLFQRYYLHAWSIADLTKEFGLPASEVQRKLVAIEAEYRTLRDLRQPPHAAD